MNPIASTLGRSGIKITDAEFKNMATVSKPQLGINLGPDKKYLIEARLGGRLKELNLKSFSEYFFHLRIKGGPEEKEYLAEAMTTIGTSFYRHIEQIKFWREKLLPDRLAAKKVGKLKVWSAGCSSGDEAGTLCIKAREEIGPNVASRFGLVGTDIDPKIL